MVSLSSLLVPLLVGKMRCIRLLVFITSVAVDAIHTRHQKLTAFIVTSHPDEVIKALQEALVRGITVMPSRGAFTQEPNTTLMMVLSL